MMTLVSRRSRTWLLFDFEELDAGWLFQSASIVNEAYMSRERLKQIGQLLEAARDTDANEWDAEKTRAIEELLTELGSSWGSEASQ